LPRAIPGGAPPAATFDHASGAKETHKRDIEQREHTEAGGQHEQQSGQEQADAEILEQVTSSQPIMPLPATALGGPCSGGWYSGGPYSGGRRWGRSVGGGADPCSGLGSRHEVPLVSGLQAALLRPTR
jgi:hypothetical protein